jgi:DoxX-like family
MNPRFKQTAVPGLRGVLGLVVIWESLRFILSSSSVHHLASMGLPQWVRPAVGGVEIVAAILFLLPPTMIMGGYVLLAVFAFATVIHILHGEYGVGGLLVYFMAVIVCMAHSNVGARESSQ